jgi:hypothetical protein
MRHVQAPAVDAHLRQVEFRHLEDMRPHLPREVRGDCVGEDERTARVKGAETASEYALCWSTTVEAKKSEGWCQRMNRG